ncbi:unnamed protein product [Dicrocoelium dendriticum]|nr:unnamed protein product [Dicrocoelium dendriticum]
MPSFCLDRRPSIGHKVMEDLPPSLQLTHGVIGYHDFPIPSTNHMDYADVGVWIDTSVPPPRIVKPCISSALRWILPIDRNNSNPLTPINALRNQQPISDMMQRTQPNSPAPTGYCRNHGLFPSNHFLEGHTQSQPLRCGHLQTIFHRWKYARFFNNF